MNGILININQETIFSRGPGAHRIASELRSNGWDIEVVDFLLFWSFDELTQLLHSRINDNTKFIGFSSIFGQWPELAEKISVWIKTNYPNVVIIYGTLAYTSLKTKSIDYQFMGFGEAGVLSVLKYLFSNGEPVPYKLVSNGIKLIQLEGSTPWKNPIIIYEDRDFIQPYEWLGTEFSRGCKFKCDFCTHPYLGVKGDWHRGTDNFELQMKDAYDRFGATRYMVSDETFNDSTEKITKFANVVEKLNFEPFFTGFIRADLLINRGNSELDELSRMGFYGQFYGVESFNHKSAKSVKKGLHPDKVKEGLLKIKNHFYSTNKGYYRGTISLIAGLPFETEESILSTYEWLKENWQGENFLLNPLEIQKLSLADSVNSGTSAMALDYAKYGYTEMLEEVPLDGIYKPFFKQNTVLWQNEHTNYYKVKELVETVLNDSINHDFRVMNFHPTLWNQNMTIEEILKIKESEFSPFDETTKLAKEYINKKLSI